MKTYSKSIILFLTLGFFLCSTDIVLGQGYCEDCWEEDGKNTDPWELDEVCIGCDGGSESEDSGDCTDIQSDAWPCSGSDIECPDGEMNDCSDCDTDGSGCGDSNGSSGGSNQEEPDDDDDDDARCDAGEVKNVNGECVPCPNGNCNDCGKTEFRDICGECTNEIISEPKVVEGRCNGIETMQKTQSKTNKEVAGFFTASGKMIVLPNNDPRQSSNRAVTKGDYEDSSGNLLFKFFQNGSGQWKVNYYTNGVWVSSENIVGHYHTHPLGGAISQEDKDFTQGDFKGIDHYYNLTGNAINEYNVNKVTNTETINCKKNPEPVNNC